jgi:tellurium resistance protein TerD
MSDIFDTRFEGKKVEIDDGLVHLGGEMNLTGKDPTLKKVMLGAGWDLNSFGSAVVDLDLSIFLLNKHELTAADEDFVFYNQKETCGGGVRHGGDSRTGAGDGDDEIITLDLHSIPFDVMKVQIVLSIYKGYEKDQHLEQVRNAYVRVVNDETKHELARFQIDSVLKDKQETAVIIGALNREGPKWHFRPNAEFVEGGLGAVARRYGCIINQE